MIGFTLALMAGSCAAVASVFAKLTMSPAMWKGWICETLLVNWTTLDGTCNMMIATARLSSLFLVFLCNAVMWTLFVKSLRKCGSSAEATVANSASNFVCTAILGQLIFGERSSLQWWLGISLVLSGLILIHFSNEEYSGKKDVKVD